MRHTLLNTSSRWTHSFPNFYLVTGASGEFFRCDLFPMFVLSVEEIFSDEDLETRNVIEKAPSMKQLILRNLTSCSRRTFSSAA